MLENDVCIPIVSFGFPQMKGSAVLKAGSLWETKSQSSSWLKVHETTCRNL